MERSNTHVVACVMVLSIAAAAAVVKARSAQAAIDLEITFDGGYVYNTGAKEFVEVKTLQKGGHPMRVQLDRGRWSPGGISDLRLKDATVELWPDGKPPAKSRPALPPYTAKPGCDQSDRKTPNNLFFLPNLAEPAKLMETRLRRGPAPTRTASIMLTGGGELRIRQVGGCIEYRNASGVPGEPRSMASGVGGVVYTWQMPAKTLTLHITPDGGTPLDIVVSPVAGRIELRVGTLWKAHPLGKAPYRIAEFSSFDDVFGNIDEPKRVTMWWRFGFEVSPGIDCPSGADPDPWP